MVIKLKYHIFTKRIQFLANNQVWVSLFWVFFGLLVLLVLFVLLKGKGRKYKYEKCNRKITKCQVHKENKLLKFESSSVQ